MTESFTTPGKNIVIAGLLLQLAPLVGITWTIAGMISGFQTLGSSGVGDPAALSGAISTALVGALLGFSLGLIGFVLIGYALLISRFRAPWFFKTLLAISVLWIISFPIGTLFGGLLLFYLISHKSEFIENA
jgi:ABC-type tungstate transport system substrate-binding protein